jgi:hypothetical protein
MADKLVTIASHLTAQEAHLAKNSLEGEGIPAVLADEETENLLGFMVGFVGGVKLLVTEDHAHRACELLATLSGNPADAPPDERVTTTRTCPSCGQAFGAESDDCPQCGPPADTAVESSEEPWLGVSQAEDETEGAQSPADEMARRALWSAVLGATLCPLVMTVYAMYLIIRLYFGKEELRPGSWTKVYIALALCAVELGIFALYWSVIIAR